MSDLHNNNNNKAQLEHTMSTLVEIASAEAFSSQQQQQQQQSSVLLFGAEWHEACPMLKMVLGALAAAPDNESLFFGSVDAEGVPDLSERFEVTMVPTILLLVGGVIRERLEGEILADPSHVTLAVQRLARTEVSATGTEKAAASSEENTATASTTTTTTTPGGDDPKKMALDDRLERLIHADTVMLFMKGNPDKPRCGFSRQAVELLREEKVPFGSFDILTDSDVRQGLKTYSEWPTYPQIYVRGELMGGLDIMKETSAEGSLKEDWEITDLSESRAATGEEDKEVGASLQDRLAKLVKRHTVMLFMKGLPSNPQCGFSRQIVEILDDTGVSYDAFNVFEDEEVRQGLKEFSDWPTYPQLYHEGELLGGLDIVRELQESGELAEMLLQQ